MYENNDNNNYRVQNVGVFIVQRNNVNVNKQGSTFRKVCQQNGIYIKKKLCYKILVVEAKLL